MGFKKKPGAFGKAWRKSGGWGNVGMEVVFGAALVGATAMVGAGSWGAQTGLEEDYVGGAVYGASRGVGMAVGGVIGGVVGAVAGAFAPIPGASLVGNIAGNLIGEGIGGALFEEPAQNIGMMARSIVKSARAIDTVQFGRGFQDSRDAYTMRQRAVQEMSGSMMNARQYLGNEAAFLHA
jgi:hypothetical protein